MIHSFPVPEMLDSVDFTKLVKTDQQQMKKHHTGEMITNQDQHLKRYLSQTVDLMEIMSKQKTSEIQFKYQRKFALGKKGKDIKINTNNEEATAIENLMARYIYALAFYKEKEHESFSQLNYFFVKPGEESEKFNKNVLLNWTNILNVYYDGYKQLRKCKQMFVELSTSFGQMKKVLPELDQFILEAVLNVLEANANYFYLNMQKYQQNYEKMAKIAICTSNKLKTAFKLMSNYKYADQNLKDYCKWGSLFYRCFALSSLITHYQYMAEKLEKYPPGMDYRTTTAAYVSMADTLLKMYNETQQCPKNQGHIKSAFNFFYNNVWSPQAYKVKQIYTDVVKENLGNPDLGNITLNGIQYGAESDYCQQKWSKEFQ